MKKLILVLTIALGLMLLLPATAPAGLVSRDSFVGVGGFVDWYGEEWEYLFLTYNGDMVFIDYVYAGHASSGELEPFTGRVTLGGGGSIDAIVPLGDETEPDATVHLTLKPYGPVDGAGLMLNKWWQFNEEYYGGVLHYLQAALFRSVTVDGYIDIPGVLHLTVEQWDCPMWKQQLLQIVSTTAAVPPGQGLE